MSVLARVLRLPLVELTLAVLRPRCGSLHSSAERNGWSSVDELGFPCIDIRRDLVIDIAVLQNDPDLVRRSVSSRSSDVDVDLLISVDAELRQKMEQEQQLRAQQRSNRRVAVRSTSRRLGRSRTSCASLPRLSARSRSAGTSCGRTCRTYSPR